MKPVYHLLVLSFKYSLIMVCAFAIYDYVKKWQEVNDPEHANAHAYGRLIHWFTIFIAYFIIGLCVYYAFNVI